MAPGWTGNVSVWWGWGSRDQRKAALVSNGAWGSRFRIRGCQGCGWSVGGVVSLRCVIGRPKALRIPGTSPVRASGMSMGRDVGWRGILSVLLRAWGCGTLSGATGMIIYRPVLAMTVPRCFPAWLLPEWMPEIVILLMLLRVGLKCRHLSPRRSVCALVSPWWRTSWRLETNLFDAARVRWMPSANKTRHCGCRLADGMTGRYLWSRRPALHSGPSTQHWGLWYAGWLHPNGFESTHLRWLLMQTPPSLL